MTDIKIILFGADNRMEYTEKELKNAGYSALLQKGTEIITAGADYLVLSPTAKQAFASDAELPCKIFSSLKKDGKVLCYSSADYYHKLSGKECIDYSEDEQFRSTNNVSSCEGAISKIIAATPFCINGCKVLLTGFGFLAKGLLPALTALGANISIAARKKEALEKARTLSLGAFELRDIEKALADADIVINTVPHRIFPQNPEVSISGKYFFELASKPYGFDADYYRLRGAICTVCPSLPSKYAPESSGKALGKAIIRLIQEQI